MSASEAYRKMLEDGSAFKEVDMTMHTEPDIMEAQGVGNNLGERVEDNSSNAVQENERNDNYEEFDSAMEERINNLKSKIKNGGKITTTGTLKTPTQKKIMALEKRVQKLEEALMLVMETQSQLFE